MTYRGFSEVFLKYLAKMRYVIESTLKSNIANVLLACFQEPFRSVEPFYGKPFSRGGPIMFLKIPFKGCHALACHYSVIS